jgi:broad specificity phosphatase PhoE
VEITIMRHGRPEIDLEELKQLKIAPNRLGEIVCAYESVGLRSSSRPPDDSIKTAKRCNLSISSDLPRALASIKSLGLESKNLPDACFRESPIPYPKWKRPSLSFLYWAIALRVAWLLGFSKNGESIQAAKKRAQIGALKLHNFAHAHQSVLLLGHGIMNRLVTKELKKSGWQEKVNTGEQYWSYSVLELGR